jgi:hypothetical protein
MKNPNTLLTRFYGMHRVKPHKKKEVHFLIMGSVFYTQRQIHRTFDLKGSKQGRNATEREKLLPSCVYKDNDFLEANMKIQIEPGRAEVLRQNIASDVAFLCKLKIMDYSLLLGVNDLKQQAIEDKKVDDERKRRDGRRDAPPATPTTTAASTTTSDGKETKVRFDLGTNGVVAAGSMGNGVPIAVVSSSAATSTPTTIIVTSTAVTSSAPTAGAPTPTLPVTTSSGTAVLSTPTTSIVSPSPTSGGVAHAGDTAEVKVAAALNEEAKTASNGTTATATSNTGDTITTAASGGGGTLSTLVVEDGKDPLLDIPSGSSERRQTRYGLPKRYNAFSRPQDIDFVAPAFADVHLRPVAPAKKPVIEPVVSLFTTYDGGLRGWKNGQPTDEVYYMGVIDILTEYGVKKKMEYQAKSLKYDKVSSRLVPHY